MVITRISTPMTKILAEKYITFYCEAREKGETIPDSLFSAKYYLQSFIIDLMISDPNRIHEIKTAYENIKQDDTLQERALIIFDLSTCEESIRAKYMPLFCK